MTTTTTPAAVQAYLEDRISATRRTVRYTFEVADIPGAGGWALIRTDPGTPNPGKGRTSRSPSQTDVVTTLRYAWGSSTSKHYSRGFDEQVDRELVDNGGSAGA